mgnify:CR=1 FL=1|tara:strand:+ start:769 stop:1206 length:438 start_codon:yes stop_codon:yes gene_type:complete
MKKQEPEFCPELTPDQMLEHGVFGGWYFEQNYDDLSPEWLTRAKLSSDGFDVSLNCFEVASGQSREVWQEKGWITLEDPLGWFQWYCRYYQGRRIEAVDAFQIKRWRSFGARHKAQIRNNCDAFDFSCRRVQRQALLQWAYDPFF